MVVTFVLIFLLRYPNIEVSQRLDNSYMIKYNYNKAIATQIFKYFYIMFSPKIGLRFVVSYALEL